MRRLFFISTSLFATLSDKCRLLDYWEKKKNNNKKKRKKKENLGAGSGDVPGGFEFRVMTNFAPHSMKRLVRRVCLLFGSVGV